MSRSVWKVPYLNNIFFSNMVKNKNVLKIWDRRSSISSYFVNKKFRVHNGVWLLTINLKASMVGYKLGEFSFTKKMGRDIHFKKDNKKRK